MPGARTLPGWRDLNLSIGLQRGWASAGIAMIAGAAWGATMALADATVFSGVIPAVQRELVHGWTIAARLQMFVPGAITDEVTLRLLGMTIVVWLLTLVGGAPGRRWHIAAALFTALVLWPLRAGPYLAGVTGTGTAFAREFVLHGGAGVLWGWLYARQGWCAAVVGHVSAHLVLQPLLSLIG